METFNKSQIIHYTLLILSIKKPSTIRGGAKERGGEKRCSLLLLPIFYLSYIPGIFF